MNKIFKCSLYVAVIIAAMLTGCKKGNGIEIDTTSVTNITQIAAASGGNIAKDGGSALTCHGICWSTSPDPTVYDNKTKDTIRTETGTFTDKIIGLIPNTLYYIRAYAVNSEGPSYGNSVSFTTSNYGDVTDIDGNVYKTLTFDTQTWMADNLKTTKYGNGDLIGTTTPSTLDITTSSAPKYQWAYNGDESEVAANGRYYTFFATMDNRSICPTGWHVPTDSEWWTLITYLTGNGYGYGGSGDKIAKSMASTSGWTTNLISAAVGNNPDNNNSSGFDFLPCGYRIYTGLFDNKGKWGYLWTSSESGPAYGNIYELGSGESLTSLSGLPKSFGLPVRCVKD